MAYKKKESGSSPAFQKLKQDLAEGTPGSAYLFYGEESYLRQYYLRRLREVLIPAGAEEFNYHALEGKDLTVQQLCGDGGGHAHDGPADHDRGDGHGPVQAGKGAAGAAGGVFERRAALLLRGVRVRHGGLQAGPDHEAAVQGHRRPCGGGGVPPGGERGPAGLDRPAVPGSGQGDRPPDGGVPGVPVRRAHDGPGAGDRQDRRLRQGLAGSPRRMWTPWRTRCCRRRCSSCPTR